WEALVIVLDCGYPVGALTIVQTECSRYVVDDLCLKWVSPCPKEYGTPLCAMLQAAMQWVSEPHRASDCFCEVDPDHLADFEAVGFRKTDRSKAPACLHHISPDRGAYIVMHFAPQYEVCRA